jgi:hypothetical protein
VIEFAHDAAMAELTLTSVKKPWLVPECVLWSGFITTLDRCRYGRAIARGTEMRHPRISRSRGGRAARALRSIRSPQASRLVLEPL